MSDSDGIGSLLQSLGQQQNEWSFVVSDQWITVIQSLSIVSLLASLGVLSFIAHILLRHRKYLQRLSLRISGYVALADLVGSITQILGLHNDLMVRQSSATLRFILWLSMASTLWFVFLTLCISLQLHLSTLTSSVRVRTYIRLEKFYVPVSAFLAVLLPGVAVAVMDGMYWNPYMHSFDWPTEGWRRKLVLWMCCYVWVVLTILYCSTIAFLLSLRIWTMWRNSVQVVEEPRMPEKWDWSSLTASARVSAETIVSTTSLLPQRPGEALRSTLASTRRVSFSQSTGTRSGYLLTVMRTDKETGQPIAVRSYVDKKRFLRSIQRLVCYPLVPIVTQLGVVAMNMATTPTKALYIYGTALASVSGLLNLGVFLLNPSLPDIWRDAAVGQTL